MKSNYTPETATLLAYIRNEVSDTQKVLIETWANSSPENEKILLDLARIYYAERSLGLAQRWNTAAAYKKVQKHIAHRSPFRIDWRLAAAAVVAICVLNAGLWAFRASNYREEIVLSSNAEKKVEYTLPDGTVVYLNRNSSLTFPVRYDRRERRVLLDGEAYFEVAPNAKKPFIVMTHNRVEIRVLGTKFNLEAYACDSIVRAALLEGSVCVHINDHSLQGQNHILIPSDELRYNALADNVSFRKNHAVSGIEWMNNTFVFKDTALPEVVRLLSHNFGVDFVIADPELRSYLFTGTFDNRELSLILEYMRISSGIKIQIDKTDSGRERITLCQKK